ncbi:hypothetical protein ITP53_45895 [Nonomuraea sp. K274]|uniref:Uncharacterized protein n=1 Tax=Nonomuraea cypriaca TaxID=1187855 RepID=A0A931F4Q2_9ACTN|nr:hypothetical protein [Nonomuraea cypriaca]MBF8192892.1 hypothetical protein [Nonomuraea cypriaca]
MKKALIAVLACGSLLATSTPALAHTTQAPKAALGPYGYGKVKLGMSAKKTKATGRVVLKMPVGEGTCSGWDLKAYPTGKNSVGLYISKRRGVAVIFAPKGVRTPEGIGIGSTMKQIKKAYPGLKTAASGFPYVSVPGNPTAYYAFFASKQGEIEELSLGLDTQDCVN